MTPYKIPSTFLKSDGAREQRGEQGSDKKTIEANFFGQSKKVRFLDRLALQRAMNVIPKFHSVDLSHVDLGNLDLSRVDFKGADLTNANLTGANLAGADLTGAKFFRTIFTNAHLTGANFTDATMDRATQLSWQQALNQNWLDAAQKKIPDFAQRWKTLKTLDGFNAFEIMLKRLNEWRLKNSVTTDEIVAVIESVIKSADVSRLVFDVAHGADAKCAYHLLTNFNMVQGLARLGKLVYDDAEPHEIVALAKKIVRQNLLDEATLPVMRNQWEDGRRSCNGKGTGPDVRGASQVQLALRCQLSDELKWLFPVRNPLDSIEVASLHDADKEFALDIIEKTMSDQDQLVTMLTALPAWQLYLERVVVKKRNTLSDDGSVSLHAVMREETEKMVGLV